MSTLLYKIYICIEYIKFYIIGVVKMKGGKKNIVVFGAVAIALLVASSSNTLAIMQSNEFDQEPYSLYFEDMEEELYDYMNDNTIGQVKQAVYESLEGDPEGYSEIMEGADAFFDVLPIIGVTDDMTILEADSIVEDNWDVIEDSIAGRALKVNKWCSVNVIGYPFSNSWARPRMLFFRPALRCIWNIDPAAGCSVTINGRRGLQNSEDTTQRGLFIPFAGRSESTFRGHVTITGFTWISISDAPFTGDGEYSCQQSNLQSNPLSQ